MNTSGTTANISSVYVMNCPAGRWWEGLIAQPTARINEAGMCDLVWPENEPDVCVVERSLMVQMVAELNELRVLRRWVERDVS